jgi:hypothetical protein
VRTKAQTRGVEWDNFRQRLLVWLFLQKDMYYFVL